MAKDKAIVVKREPNVSIESVIQNAIDKGVPVETMERLLAMRRELRDEAAKEAYTEALGRFQEECPVIRKTKKVMNKDGRTVRYQFAPLDSIAEQIKKPIRNNHFTYSWDTKREAQAMVVTCTLTHMLGHSAQSTLEIPIDAEGFMTAPQKVASATSFAKRYTLLNVTGITTADEDTDASDVGKEQGAKSEKSKIIFLLRALKEKTGTKEEVQEAVKRITSLPLEPGNYSDIIARLSALVEEIHEGTEVRD